LTIDGADEVSIELNGIKGGGGALLFEKIIAKNSDINIWIVDHSKLVNKLGNFPLPIEIVPFATKSLLRKFEMMKLNPKLRMNGDMIFTTDSQNHIIDCYLGDIANPIDLEYELKLITGVVEVGLFNQIANKVIIGYPDKTEILVRK
jgi:ribose 5-phosphate isomerase A